MSSRKIQRGDIFRLKTESGQVQNFLVVQNDIGNKYCDSIIVVPLTRNSRARLLLFAMPVEGNSVTGLEQDYVAVFSLIRTLAKDKFIKECLLGSLQAKSMAQMDRILKLSLGLSTLQQLSDRRRKKKTS